MTAMGKAKNKVPGASVPNKHLHSRVNYLYQAAKYLDANSRKSKASTKSGNSRHLVNQLQGIALKSQIRLASSVKHSLCKRCQVFLEEGITLASRVENQSKGGLKKWADVLVRECTNCGANRRFPVGAKRQKRRQQRSSEDEKDISKAVTDTGNADRSGMDGVVPPDSQSISETADIQT